MSDGEVEETVNGITHFAGANVWEMSLSGNVLRTANISQLAPTTVPMTNEPTGIAWNPNNGHVYVSDDDAVRVYDLNPGVDHLIGTADDSWTSFSTLSAGNGDPEGIAYDSWRNCIFVIDGVNAEIYQYSLTGSLLSHVDVLAYGAQDPESVEFNPDRGSLWVLSGYSSVIVETTIGGDLLQSIDISSAHSTAAAGLAFAPSSNGSGTKNFYIVDRGIDNNANPNLIDGKMYEMTAPASITPGNTPPVVDAGTDKSVTYPNDIFLHGTISDDGIPLPGNVTVLWNMVSGPGMATFDNPNSVDTKVTLSTSGTYLLNLTANDGELTSSDSVSVTLVGGPVVFETRITASSDDAEEAATGGAYYTSSDLELVYDGGNQIVGMRFINVAIPAGASITYAYIQFKADEVNSEATSLTLVGEANDNAATFTTSSLNISSRNKTTASVSWSPVPWTVVGDAGINQRTPDLSALIREIIIRPGWTSGQAIGIIITGTGHRTAVAFDGERAGAPLLHVNYIMGSANTVPTVNAGPDQTVILPNTAALDGTVADDGLPNPPGSLITTWSMTSGPGTVTFENASLVDTTAAFSTAGTYVLRLTAHDGALSASDEITIRVVTDAIFADSFESGNLIAWTSSNMDGNHLSVSAAAKLKGNYGLQAQVTDNNSLYVTDATPNAESRYRALFYFDPNSIVMAKNKSFFIFFGYNAGGTAIIQVEFRYSNGYQIRAGLLNDSTAMKNTAWYAITDAPHQVEIDWRAATTAGANNGTLILWIDGIQSGSFTSIDNDTRRIDSVRLGGVSGIDSGTRGTFYIDDFDSRRLTYIGP